MTKRRGGRNKPTKCTTAVLASNGRKEDRPVGTDYTGRLATELLLHIFELLGQPDTIAVAGVCSRWRTVAQTLPTYYAHISLSDDWAPPFSKSARTIKQMAGKIKGQRFQVWIAGGPICIVARDQFCGLEFGRSLGIRELQVKGTHKCAVVCHMYVKKLLRGLRGSFVDNSPDIRRWINTMERVVVCFVALRLIEISTSSDDERDLFSTTGG